MVRDGDATQSSERGGGLRHVGGTAAVDAPREIRRPQLVVPRMRRFVLERQDQQRLDTARSASTETAAPADQPADASDAAATPFDALKLEVVELKAEVVELKAEVERLRGEVHEHYAHVREREEAILARALQMVRRQVAAAQKPPPAHDTLVSADDTKDAVDIAVPGDAEEISHDG